jgi:cell division septation protein DedD
METVKIGTPKTETVKREVTPAQSEPSGDADAEVKKIGKFSLQIGSYPHEKEAKFRMETLEGLGLKPFFRTAELPGKGTWYRVFIGGYPSKDAAEKAGQQYRKKHVIESYIVSRPTG